MRLPTALFAISLLTTPGVALAETVLRELAWDRLDEADLATLSAAGAAVVSIDRGSNALRIEYQGNEPRTIPLARLLDPGIAESQYAVHGEVRYQNVHGDSYLEMWNLFADGSKFFSRTLASQGPLEKLTGSSGWRRFSLPFFVRNGRERPNVLEINLALQGPGTVEIGPLTLVEYLPGEDPLKGDAWWGTRGGALLGAFGGVALALVSMGFLPIPLLDKARGLMTALLVFLLLAGLGAAFAGLVALASRQPYAVYYPLLLVGGLMAATTAALLVVLPRRYAAREMRRMEAIDAS